jgi:hypothetical protein
MDRQGGALVQEAAMTLRPRRNLVLWRQSAGPGGRYAAPRVGRAGRARRIRRWIRTGALLTVIGLVALARAVWSRRRPLVPGVVLTVAGVLLRGGPLGVILLPGLMLLISAPLFPAASKARRRLERELAAYRTPAERRDLEAILDQYPDEVTHELRDILASQAMTARNNRIPAFGRR